MPFLSEVDADKRLLSDSSKLTAEEVRDLIPWVRKISEPGIRRLHVELALQNLEAIQNFDRSSRNLTRWLIGLTAILVVLTVEIAYYTYLLAQG